MGYKAIPRGGTDVEKRPMSFETFEKLGNSIVANSMLASSIATSDSIPLRRGEGTGGLSVAHLLANSVTGARILLSERRDLLDLATDSGHSVKDEIREVHGQRFIDEAENVGFRSASRA